MPNKFITNLDLARQAEIFSGETAVFQGGIQLGIPFSGFPSGVDTSTITSIGVVDTQFAAFSGDTGTTVFNVTDPSSPYYNATATTLTTSPYTVIDNDTITETVSATTYPTIMSFTALSGTSDAPISISFTPPVIQELYDRGLYGTLFDGLGLASLGQTYSDESFYNDGSIFSGANLNMEIVEYAPHGATPAWVTGTTSGTVIEYSALTQYWTDTTIINGVSGLTLPITPESAETKTIDYVWTLTDSTIIDENVVGLKYTGYSVTYSFNDVIVDPESPSAIGATGATSADTYYLGTVTASLENFSAGTLDYKGSTNWISIDGNATVTERLTVDRLTINNPGTGTPINNIGITSDGDVVFGTTGATVTGLTFNDFTYDLTVGLDNGLSFTDNLGILASDIKVTGGTFDGVTGEIEFVNNSGGTFVVSGLTTEFTGNTSGNCITDLHITNLHSCSPLYVNPLDEGNVYFGSTSGVTIDVANNRIGIGTETPSTQLHIAGSGADIRVQSTDTSNASLYFDTQTTGGGTGFRNTAIQFQENSTTQWMIGMNGLAGGSEEDKQFVIANNTSFDSDNILNINPSNGYVGLGVQAPTERLDVGGNTKISGTINVGQNNSISGTSTSSAIVGGENNVVKDVSDFSIIAGGTGNTISGGTRGAIIGGGGNYLSGDSREGIILGGSGNTMHNTGGSIIAASDFATMTNNETGLLASRWNVMLGTEACTMYADVDYSTIIGSSNSSIDGDNNNTIIGSRDSSVDAGSINTIIGSRDAHIDGQYSTIIGSEPNIFGVNNEITGDNCSMISSENSVIDGTNTEFSVVMGTLDAIMRTSDYSVIAGGEDNWMYDNSDYSAIIAGRDNRVSASTPSVIVGGQLNDIYSGGHNFIAGGNSNKIENGSTSSSIIGGNDNTIDDSLYSTIMGGSGNTLTWGYSIFPSSNGGRNAIISSEGSLLSGNTWNTVILGGQNNSVYDPNGSILTQGVNSAIIGGDNNVLTVVDDCVIVGGWLNVMSGANHNSCVIVGGVGNELLDTGISRSVVLGGQNITAYSDDTVYTPDLIVSGNSIVSNNSTVNNDLLVNGDADFDGGVLQTGVNLYGVSTAAINLTNKSIVRFELDGTITGPSIAAGSAGQRIILYVETVTTAGTTTISVPGGLGFTQIVFSSLADSVEMIYDSGSWVILSSRGATIS